MRRLISGLVRSRPIRFYTVFDFRLKPLFASVDMPKFNDGRVPSQKLRGEGVNCHSTGVGESAQVGKQHLSMAENLLTLKLNLNALTVLKASNKGPYYCIYPKNGDRQTWVNSIAPDQMLQKVTSDQGPHCLSLIQQFFKHINRY